MRELLRRPFKFEQFWISHPELLEFIKKWWREFDPPRRTNMFQFQKKLKYVKERVKSWNKESFRNIHQEKKHLEG